MCVFARAIVCSCTRYAYTHHTSACTHVRYKGYPYYVGPGVSVVRQLHSQHKVAMFQPRLWYGHQQGEVVTAHCAPSPPAGIVGHHVGWCRHGRCVRAIPKPAALVAAPSGNSGRREEPTAGRIVPRRPPREDEVSFGHLISVFGLILRTDFGGRLLKLLELRPLPLRVWAWGALGGVVPLGGKFLPLRGQPVLPLLRLLLGPEPSKRLLLRGERPGGRERCRPRLKDVVCRAGGSGKGLLVGQVQGRPVRGAHVVRLGRWAPIGEAEGVCAHPIHGHLPLPTGDACRELDG